MPVRYSFVKQKSACSSHEYYYLLYIPDGGQSPSTSFGTDSSLFGTTLNLRLERTGYSGSLYCVQTSVDRPPVPRVVLGGKRIRCETQVVDYNPTLFFIEPNYAKAEPGSTELPERLSVVKIVGSANVGTAEVTGSPDVVAASENAGVVEIADKDLMLKILSAIDNGKRVQVPNPPGSGKDIAEGKGVHREVESEGSRIWGTY